MDKFAEAFPLSEELLAVFMSKEDFDKLSEDEKKGQEQKAQEAVVKALDQMVEWKAHFPADVTEAVSVLARAVGYGVPVEVEVEEEVKEPENTGTATKALEAAIGKMKELISAFSEAASTLETQLASKMLRAAKGEAVQFDDLSIEITLGDDKPVIVPASEFIALMKEATAEVLTEGVE